MTVVVESIPPPTVVRLPLEETTVVVAPDPQPTVVKLGSVVDTAAAQILSYKFTPEQYGAVGDASVAAATYGINGHDDSVPIQTAIDNASANAIAGGKTAIVEFQAKGYFCNVILKPGVVLKGSGFATKLLAAPGSNTPVLGSIKAAAIGPDEPVRIQIHDLCVDGNFANATGRGIEIVSSNNDAFTGAHPTTAPGIWNVNDPAVVLENVIVQRCATTAVKLGRNMRGTQVMNLFCFQNRGIGLHVSGTDGQYSNVQAGICGLGIMVDGQDNQFHNCKTWYAGITVGGAMSVTTGTVGNGWEITAGHNSLNGCRSQDNDNYGLSIHDCDGVQVSGHAAGGDIGGCVYMRSVHGSSVDVQMMGADRGGTAWGFTIDFGNVYDNMLRFRDYFSVGRMAGYKIVRLLNGATMSRNVWQLPGDNAIFPNNYAANLTPLFEFGKTITMTLTGNLTVNAPGADAVVAPGQEVAFQFTQDATGSRTVTWDAAYGTNVPPIDPTPNSVTTFRFVNVGNGATPTLKLNGSSRFSTAINALQNTYRTIVARNATILPAQANTRQLIYENGLIAEATANAAFAAFRLDPADFVVPPGRSLKLRLRATLIVNGTAPGAGSSFTPTMYSVTPAAGGANGAALTLGGAPIITGPTQNTPGALATVPLTSADIDFPAAGNYTFAIGISAMAAASAVTVRFELQARIV